MKECIPGMLVYDGSVCIWFNLYRSDEDRYTYEFMYNYDYDRSMFVENGIYSVQDSECTL